MAFLKEHLIVNVCIQYVIFELECQYNFQKFSFICVNAYFLNKINFNVVYIHRKIKLGQNFLMNKIIIGSQSYTNLFYPLHFYTICEHGRSTCTDCQTNRTNTIIDSINSSILNQVKIILDLVFHQTVQVNYFSFVVSCC